MNITAGFHVSLTLANVFVKIFARDRQAIFFSVFFPIIFIFALGARVDGTGASFNVGLLNLSNSALAQEISETIQAREELNISLGDLQTLKQLLSDKKISALIVIPKNIQGIDEHNRVQLITDSSQVSLAEETLAALRPILAEVERKVHGLPKAYELAEEDIQGRSLRYIDFLLPGILAFSLMQISMAGSAYNVVEYRRKGILKRLFVTPLAPGSFIAGLVLARLGLVIVQISILLALSVGILDVEIAGSLILLYLISILGATTFLCMGFTLGSFAKTQQSIQALGNIIIFPQLFLSGIFYPIESLPEIIQPIASLLPLTFIADALRGITASGLSIADISVDVLGILVWTTLAFVLAARYFVWREVAR